MFTIPLIPETAPFSSEQRAWLNGFFAGLFSRGPAAGPAPMPAPIAPALQPLTILFGSQTGTAETLAKRAAREAGKRGFAPTVLDMAQAGIAQLAAEQNLLLITSTYGDGEPPDNARVLHTALAATAPGAQLAALRYAVCSLGDSNYTQFCRCGADFDAFLEKLGAARIVSRADCDLDYEEKFNAWLDAALSAFSTTAGGPSPQTVAANAPSPAPTKPATGDTSSGYGRANAFPALVLASRNLNGAGSAKQVHHVEFDLADSSLAYEAGDALGVYPHNCPAPVSEILIALGCDGEEAVPAPDGSATSLRRALAELYDLGRPSAELLSVLAPAAVGRVSELPAASRPHHVIDALLARTDVKLSPADFVRTLKKLQPRLYSISSSPHAHAGQVHLTVGAVRYALHGRLRKGACSTFLAERVVPGESRVGVFIHSNRAFRLPASSDAPVIMIGPGTGIAPFRAFLHQRRADGARGRNWLFFGDQHAATDFLYRDELTAFVGDGTLSRLDTAFSRDQPEKIYVQQRMLEQSHELYAWLEAGAHLYVCGDASRMAKDVDAALHHVIERAGGKTPEAAAAYVQALRTAQRYARDVY